MIVGVATGVNDIEAVFNVVGAICSSSIGVLLPTFYYFMLVRKRKTPFTVKYYVAVVIFAVMTPYSLFSVVAHYVKPWYYLDDLNQLIKVLFMILIKFLHINIPAVGWFDKYKMKIILNIIKCFWSSFQWSCPFQPKFGSSAPTTSPGLSLYFTQYWYFFSGIIFLAIESST